MTVLFATLCLVCLITREKVFFTPGQFVNAFLFGSFGYFAYGVVIYAFVVGVRLITGKKFPLSKKNVILVTAICSLSALLAHVIALGTPISFGEYISKSYLMAEGGIATCSPGGFCVALIAYPIANLLTVTGASVMSGIAIVVLVSLLVLEVVDAKKKGVRVAKKFRSTVIEDGEKEEIEVVGERDYPIGEIEVEEIKPAQKLFVNNEEDFSFKSKREMAKDQTEIKIDFSETGLGISRPQGVYTEAYADEMKKKIEYIKTPAKFDYDLAIKNSYYGTKVSEEIPAVKEVPKAEEVKGEPKPSEIPMYEHDSKESEAEIHAEDFTEKYASGEERDTPIAQTEEGLYRPFVSEEPIIKSSDIEEAQEILAEETKEEVIPIIEETEEPKVEIEDTPKETNISLRNRRSIFFDPEEKAEEKPSGLAFESKAEADGNISLGRGRFTEQPKESTSESVEEKKPIPINRVYNKPPLDLLEKHDMPVDAPTEDHEGRMAIIKQTLEEFHINAEPTDYIQGPTITRYEIKMPPGISVKRVLNYDDDLKMRLLSKDGVRIEAPIPGKDAVGIEVANKTKITVGLRELLEQTANVPSSGSKLIFALGKDIVGKAITDNLAKGPHYLVAGATGSGKSVCLNVMIISLLMRYSPEELRLILIDPKSVGFRIYNHIPHLMVDEIITEPKKALAALSWTQIEMERRYKVFEACPELIMDIEAYNERIAGPTVARMPRIVVVIDELADLMETCKKDMESKIRAIAQKARAAGIHLVLATQRPSVDIITGTIKTNLPSRIALKVMNFNDSQTILSEAGAEKLLGNGDMLYKNSSMAECERYQGAWISDREITNVVKYIIEHNESYFEDDLKDFLEKSTNPPKEETSSMGGGDGEEGDTEVSELFLQALSLAITSGSASIAQLQRRFRLGYARAGGLIDKMELMGFISGNEGAKARRVLITREEFEQRFGPLRDSY